MIEIRFVCNLEKLTPAEKPVIASGDVNSVQLRVDFCQKWDKYAKAAVFFRKEDPTPIECPMADDACIVPPEVLAESGTFYFGIRGVVADDATAAVLTTDVVGYRVVNGAPSGVETGPTPDVYQQILTGYGKMDATKQNKLAWATDADIEAMFEGTYEGEEDEDPEGNGYLEEVLAEAVQEAQAGAEAAATRAATAEQNAGENAEAADVARFQAETAASFAAREATRAEEAAARAEAGPPIKQYELIEAFTLEAGTIFERTQEPNGTPYKLERLLIKASANSSVATYFTCTAQSNGTNIAYLFHNLSAGNKEYGLCEAFQECGYWRSISHAQTTQTHIYGYVRYGGADYTAKHAVSEYPYITRIFGAGATPCDVDVEIWGVRANA